MSIYSSLPNLMFGITIPGCEKNPIKSMVLAEKHWKGVISAEDAQTFRVYDSFLLLETQDENVIADQKFGYQPFVIYLILIKNAIDQITAEGYSFSELDQNLDEFYASDRKKKKAIMRQVAIIPLLPGRSLVMCL
jgi:hypothetical protein